MYKDNNLMKILYQHEIVLAPETKLVIGYRREDISQPQLTY